MWASWRRRLGSGQTGPTTSRLDEWTGLGVSSGADGEHSSREALAYLFPFPSTPLGQGMAWRAYERVAPHRVCV